jgi:hypothetical protein
MGLAFSPVVGQVPVVGSYRAAEFFNAQVQGQDARLGYFQQNLSLLAPLWQNATDEFTAHARLGIESFNTTAVLPDTHDRFPAELWNVNLGAGYRHLFENGWITGGSVSFGSASDKPFESINVMSIGAQAFLRVPQGEHNAWIFTLSMSSNSQILPFIPIPGIAYLWAPGPQFQALVGFPFANMTYRPTEDWTIQVSYALLTNFHTQVTYRLTRPLRLFAAFDLENQNYYRAKRVDINDRFFSYDDRLSAGVQAILGPHASFSVSAGYLFERFFFESTNSTSQNFNRVNVGDGAFVGASLQVRY